MAYQVTILRTERITFQVDTDDRAEALESYLHGDEVFSETTSIIEEVVERV